MPSAEHYKLPTSAFVATSSNSALDDDGDLTRSAQERIKSLARQSGDPTAFARDFADRCRLSFDDLTTLMKGTAPVPNANGERIMRAIIFAEAPLSPTVAGALDAGGTGDRSAENEAFFADLDALVDEAEATETETTPAETEATDDFSDFDALIDEAEATEPETESELVAETVEHEPEQEHEPEPETQATEEPAEHRQSFATTYGPHLPVYLRDRDAPEEPSPSIPLAPEHEAMLDEVEREAAEADAKAAAKAAEERSKRRPARLDATTGKHYPALRARARAVVEPALAKVRDNTLNDIRKHLPRLDKELEQRIDALRNAGKRINDPILRQICRSDEQIVDAGRWWQAIAVAHLLHGVDATLHQIAEARRTMDRRAGRPCNVSTDRANAKRQAQTARDRTARLECPGMPWRKRKPQ